ncbi:glycosyltransferase family 39 protein [Pseudorhodoplanes sp.]|uniref:glycosyltransferase family 39 protein n=1 Tax=Pseudorhodoplanes sp. TaxID=1934341 RepID=UPI002CBCE198|nr:glycosyltransferase family 39 protein [Pseudorhodoplanes sp.]HWV43148.1 glycosyltransferase family 39 protein [Pseudorhodoplanes sp.]
MDARTATADGGVLSAIVDFALRKPGRALAILLAAHFLIWLILPILTSHNLELDLAEDLALGKEWQLGYWKHPPLPWWVADVAYRLTGQIKSVYALGPLAVIACFIGVYLLARDIAGPVQALLATLALVGIHYYNYSAVKFAHDQMQLPFWAFTALFFYRGLVRGRTLDWMLTGAMLALAFWSKYAALPFAISLALFLLIDPVARPTLRTRGPWLMAAAFLVVIAPNAWWLVESGFLPLQYVSERARPPEVWYDYITLPAKWIVGQIFFIFPSLALLALTLIPRTAPAMPVTGQAAFARRYATTLALGPFLVVTVLALIAGRFPVQMWGYPLWSFLPLAALLWLGPVTDPKRLRLFGAGVIFLFLLAPTIWIGSTITDKYFRSRPKASDFPGRAIAEMVTREWHAKTGTKLDYVAGTEFVANSVAVYSPDRPRVVVHGRPKISPWIDMDDLRKRGVLVIWEDDYELAHVDEWRETFGAEGEPEIIELPRYSSRRQPKARIVYWIIPPRK